MGLDAFTDPRVLSALVAALALACACAVLSVFVVARRWAFVGEGIGHSGFGGAGVAWVLALLFPSLDTPWLPYVAVVVFCLGTAVAIGAVSRRERINADAAIGIFLVASLAWGFLAQSIYTRATGLVPHAFDALLFGQIAGVSPAFALVAGCVSAAVLITLAALGKEVVYYCLDPAMAEASGVRAGFIHYLLLVLLAMTIIVGARVIGSVLVVALLILPGTTAGLLATRLRSVLLLSLAVCVLGTTIGILAYARWHHVGAGPSIVLALFVEFLLVYAWTRVRGRPAPAG